MFLGGPTTCFCDECCGPSVSGAPSIVIRRHFDAELHNRIANDPAVRPTFGYHAGPTDLSPLIDEPEAYIFLSDGDGAAALFQWAAPRVWQAHSIFMPDSRGKYGIAAAKAMIRWMFDEKGALMIWGMTPLQHRAAHVFNRLIGMHPEGEITDAGDQRCRLWVLRERP